jgi:hypothetical protein
MDGHSPHGNRETPETPLPVGGRDGWGRSSTQHPTCTSTGSRTVS